MPVSASDIVFKKSQHSAVGISSLGGVVAASVFSQTATAPSLVTGVTVMSASNNTPGLGQLSYNPSTSALQWQPPNSVSSSGVIVLSSGVYTLGGVEGFLTVSVVFSSLPTIYRVETLTVSASMNNVFNDVQPAQALIGDVQYRCLYLQNNHPTNTASAIKLFIQNQPAGPQVLAIGFSASEVAGNGTTTGVAQSIANSYTAPTGIVFTSPSTPSTGLDFGALTAGQVRAFWQRRTVPANAFGQITLTQATVGAALTA